MEINSLKMIETQTFRLERSSSLREVHSEENEDLNLNEFILEIGEFCRQVRFIQSNFKGPDYFGLNGNLSDLQNLLQKDSIELTWCQLELDQTEIETLRNKSYKVFYRMTMQVKEDTESLSYLTTGLQDLIHSFRLAAKEAGKREFYAIKETLDRMVDDLENSHWIFSMFVRY
jgi:hypothetical protein